MAYASTRPDSYCYGGLRPRTAMGRADRGNPSRRCGMVLTRREALARSFTDHGHDAHRHSGEEGWQGRRLDGTRQRRTVRCRKIEGIEMSKKQTGNDSLKDRLSR